MENGRKKRKGKRKNSYQTYDRSLRKWGKLWILEYNAWVRDKIRVWCITKMSAVVAHLGNMILMSSLFPLAEVSFEEIQAAVLVLLMDQAPGL